MPDVEAALARGIPLAEALIAEPGVAPRLSTEEAAGLTDPAGYLGSARVFVDRVLARLA